MNPLSAYTPRGPSAYPFPPREAYVLAKYRAGAASLAIDELSTDLGRFLATAMLTANGAGRDGGLKAALDTLEPRIADGVREALSAVDLLGEPPGETAPAASKFRLFTYDELALLPPPEPLVEGVLFRDTLAGIVGPQASFKSFVALDLCLCVGTGERWQGRRVHQGAAVYVSAEGSRGLKLRASAWAKARSVAIPPACHFLTDAPQLLNEEDVDQLLIALERLHPAPLLVVIDTVARCLVGGDENSARDMGQFVANADRIRRATGGTVLMIHHVSRAGNTRGSTAFPAALDTEIMVERRQDLVTLTCTKQKDADDFLPISFLKEVVHLPDGYTSVVLKAGEESRSDELGENERRAAEILEQVFGAAGATNGQWEKACAEATPGLPHSSYYRARTRLLEAGTVVTVDGSEPGKRGARFILATRLVPGTNSVPNGAAAPSGQGAEFGAAVPHSFRSGTAAPNQRSRAEWDQ